MAGTGNAHLRPAALLRVEDLVVEFPLRDRRGVVHAVSGVSFDVLPGETLGLVGESGCGKSTTGRAIARHLSPTSGKVMIGDRDLAVLSGSELRQMRTRLQMIFQDPISSLNPRRTVERIIGEGLRIWGADAAARRQKVEEVMDAVGLRYDPSSKRRRHEFSGGQCQRISIARSLVFDPDVLICDEPVSALDVSVQAQILNLLCDMRERYDLTMLFISHDLSVVKYISDRIAVMYLGKLCEVADSKSLYAKPLHPYTATLISAAAVPDPSKRRRGERIPLTGELPSPVNPPSGCRFRTRCARARQRCAEDEPMVQERAPGHFVACHFPLDEPAEADRAGAAIVSGGSW